jgi:hypothetical protein
MIAQHLDDPTLRRRAVIAGCEHALQLFLQRAQLLQSLLHGLEIGGSDGVSA